MSYSFTVSIGESARELPRSWLAGVPRWLASARLHGTLGPSLHQFELLFAAWVPLWRLAQQDEARTSASAAGICA
jgi:hypothetical protein